MFTTTSCITLHLSVVLFVSSALAQVAASQQTRSDALFHEGTTQMLAGDFAPACDKLEASYQLAPRTGTLLNLGKHVRARRELLEARGLAERDGQSERVAIANEYIAVSEMELGFIQVAPVAELESATLQLRVDGGDVPLATNEPLAVTPGQHTLRLEARGYAAREVNVEVPQGVQVRVVFQPLERQPQATAALPAAAPAALQPTAPNEPPRRSSAWRTAALVVGIVGVAASLGFGAWALERKSALREQQSCETAGSAILSKPLAARTDPELALVARCSDNSAQRIAATGQTVAGISTVAFGIGAVSLGAWVLLPGGLLNAGAASDARAGVTLRGRF